MIPFDYTRATSLATASGDIDHRGTMALAGGTTLIDLMKINVLTPARVVYIKPLLDNKISVKGTTLTIGAGCTMAQVAADKQIASKFPALRQSLLLAASPQIRNMATIGGNLLQRSRSPYFRHVDFPDDALVPGVATGGFGEGAETSMLAILGNDDRLVATYPGDFAVILVGFDGTVQLSGPAGERRVPARQFFLLPDGASHYVPDLEPGELIVSISLPLGSVAEHSYYLKVRERSSYAFALASAAVGLELDGTGPGAKIRTARVGLGGLAPLPWNSREAQLVLEGDVASDANFRTAAEAALKAARPPAGIEFKVELAKRVIVRALTTVRDRGPIDDTTLWAMQHGRE